MKFKILTLIESDKTFLPEGDFLLKIEYVY